MDILKEAKRISENDDGFMSKEEYTYFMKSIRDLPKMEKKEMAEILLSEAIFMPNVISKKDVKVFRELVDNSILVMNFINLFDLFCETETKKPIFSDNDTAKAVAEIFISEKRCEYHVIIALLNNGHGNKEELAKYIDSVDPKVFNYSPKWKQLYQEAIEFIES